ncbi:ABC transporter substrate-binding protein [uncultured Mesotoga sp.]|uniref:ABC transporter substrate-binding protein n=1 Tax=uncultured Mesotoga sp. TaxID=1184400 RepID=UPI00259A2DBF|nr:ABC transporter substrate-binding protein [uncultured Mesotoga sp.]HNS34899.1 ABC transporter substrate-binding protein [Mesotoga sp.]HNU23261.1 ABC transporter substrate-binding protein [Mesotoga sp.]
MRRGLLILIVFATLISTSLLAQQVELKFLHRWPDPINQPFFENVVKDFEALNPDIKVNIQAISNDPFKEKIKIVLGTSEAPDVFFTWPGEFTNRFIRAGRIMDITDALVETGWIDDFVYSQLEPFIYEGRFYGVPYRIDGKVFMYNRLLFEKAGVDFVPETWEEFLVACEKLKKAGITPISFGNEQPWAISHYIGTLNQKSVPEDVWLKDLDPAKGTWDHPGYVEALKMFTQLIPYFSQFPNAIKHAEARANFFAGGSAMMYVEIVEIPYVYRDAPVEFQENWGMFVFPNTGGPGNQNYLTGYPEGFVISADTKYPEQSLRFLKYLTSREVGRREYAEVGYLNGIKNLFNEDEVDAGTWDAVQLVMEAEAMANWLDSSLHARIWDVYSVQLQMLVDGVTTPEKVMEEVRKAADLVRAEF